MPHILIAKRMGESFKRTIPHVTTLSDDQKADQRENGTLPRELICLVVCTLSA